MTKMITFALAAALLAAGAHAEPIASDAVRVADGDTVVVHGKTYRLVGFDAPEVFSPKCAEERALGVKAWARLKALVDGGNLDLTEVRCSCPAGTEGTRFCNWGRACGILKAQGTDVGLTLIAEGLARPFRCSKHRCPRREGWCEE